MCLTQVADDVRVCNANVGDQMHRRGTPHHARYRTLDTFLLCLIRRWKWPDVLRYLKPVLFLTFFFTSQLFNFTAPPPIGGIGKATCHCSSDGVYSCSGFGTISIHVIVVALLCST
jgi:hypothetical protein